jgi:tetratricopeptide (TPR) repeat protein
LVDFDGILMNDCLETYGHSSPGREYFLDHVHPSVAAHRLLALSIVQAMTRSGTVTPSQQWGEDSIALVSRRIESRIDTELQARALTNLAQVLSWAGKQEEAGPLAEQAVLLRSKASLEEDPESMFYAAVSYAMNGRDAEATALLERVVELEPINAQARWRLAALLYDQLRYEEAQFHFSEAVRLDPQDAYSYQMLGAACMKLGRYQESLAALYRASELDPDNTVIRRNITMTLKMVGPG